VLIGVGLDDFFESGGHFAAFKLTAVNG